MKTRNVRRQIVGRVLKGIPIRSHFAISLRNAKESLEQICKPGTHTAEFKSGPDSKEVAHFEIDNELQEFERDLSFIDYVQSDDADNVEQFVDVSIFFNRVGLDAKKFIIITSIILISFINLFILCSSSNFKACKTINYLLKVSPPVSHFQFVSRLLTAPQSHSHCDCALFSFHVPSSCASCVGLVAFV